MFFTVSIYSLPHIPYPSHPSKDEQRKFTLGIQSGCIKALPTWKEPKPVGSVIYSWISYPQVIQVYQNMARPYDSAAWENWSR